MDKISCNFWSRDRGPYALLIFLGFTLFVLTPLLSARLLKPIVLEIAFSVILVSGAFVVSTRWPIRLIAVFIGVLTVVLDFLGTSVTGKIIVTMDSLVSVGMLSCFAYLLAKHFLARGRTSAHRIAAAVTIYLLLGLIWARLYQLLTLIDPGSFRTQGGEDLTAAGLAYFSFVTLATLGYGDITPVHIIARNLAVLEAITGQLYLVILISKLVTEGGDPPRS